MLKALRCESGTAMVEFALLLPVLAFMLIGLVEVGRYASFSVRVSNAARAESEFAAIRPSVTAYDSSDITSAACTDAGLTCTASATQNAMQVTSSVTCTYSDGRPTRRARCLRKIPAFSERCT